METTTPTPAEFAAREPELAGRTVVVIGGSGGIGLETARRARREGAEVILTGRDPDRLRPPDPIHHVMVTAGRPHWQGVREASA
jgi:NAD(P)-dependent dehydrogenase (short-subunit alcohol dehydrogenase family)